MSISVIISNLNGERFLPRLIETLKAQRAVEIEIIVVDRESTDGSAVILALHPEIKIVSEPGGTGLVSGYHRGTAFATREHFLFINEDMWFDPDCLRRLEAQISLTDRIGAADPWQWTYDGGQLIHCGTRFRSVTWAINGVHPFRESDFNAKLPAGTRVPFPCAGAFLIHRKVYEELGGWDTSFFLDHEDIDLFVRAWQRDWHCVSVPEAKVFHAVGMSTAGTTLELNAKRPGAGKRRYISNRVGKTVVVWKYFSVSRAVWMGLGLWLVMFANNTLKLRFRIASWDLAVLSDCLQRLPSILDFRRKNRRHNLDHPGEQFFNQPQFMLGNRE